jgi:Fe2+ transport system protein FeoA
VRLTDARPGDHLALRSMPADAGTEGQVRSLGLLPGGAVRLLRRAPFHGPLLLEVDGRIIALGWKIASGLEVSLVSAPGSVAD